MKLRNLTGHTISVKTSTGIRDIPADPYTTASMKVQEQPMVSVDGVNVINFVVTNRDEILPEQEVGVKLIVSAKVKHEFPEREDLLKVAGVVKTKTGYTYARGLTW